MAIIFPPDECREIFGLGRVIIEKRDSIDHFEITIIPDTLYEKDTLAFTEKGGIFVQAKDNDSNDVDMDPYKKLKFQITSNFEYGTFIDLNGDTVKLATPIVEDVQYSDAVKGKIKFAAVRENPDSVIKCNIKVSLQEDTSKYGQHKAIVLEQTLRIIMNEPLEVQPLITGHKNDPEHNTYLKIIEESNKKTFRVLHTRGGIEVKMHKIKLTANYIDGSGGHDHTTPRRPDSEFSYTRGEKFIEIPAERIRRQNYGSFYALRDSPFNSEFLHGKEYIRSTKDTVTKFQYIASLWGDSIKIFLQSLENDKLIPDTIVIAEKIPGMQLLQENENYILIGGTDNHYGPPTFSTDHNHFGTTILCQAINNITKDYRGLNPGVKIRVNDMSLENGGKFDIGGQWRGSHAQHRIGKNVDISGKGLNDSGNLVNINIIQMRKSIRDRTGLKPLYHNPPHFHVYTN